ncbi:MAG: hypothetical protein PHG56_01095 [Tissierellia bacterium]|nr:hypothetical protein [Tissierellia bacterium]MDD3226122.1 hypothetical protein [Tissierellia bacterium]MDD4046097.1 hypothetical protein [Tissierellia bacterium]MDD4679209.1 hypothetical protein [Tissierellia bacterium]
MNKKIILVIMAVLLVITGYYIREITQKDIELIFNNKDAIYSIGLNQSYINKYTKDLVEEGNVDSLDTLLMMIAYSRDLDSYGRLSRFIANTNNDYSILFIEFKGLNGEYLDFLKETGIVQTRNFTSDDCIYLKEYLKISEEITGIIDSLIKDELYETDRAVELIAQIRKLRD